MSRRKNYNPNPEKPVSALEEEPLPADYEPCGECNYDHGYEAYEASVAHRLLELHRSSEKEDEE